MALIFTWFGQIAQKPSRLTIQTLVYLRECDLTKFAFICLSIKVLMERLVQQNRTQDFGFPPRNDFNDPFALLYY